MKEMDLRIKACVGISTVPQIVGTQRFGLAGISPPLARGLPRHPNHGVQQHNLCDR